MPRALFALALILAALARPDAGLARGPSYGLEPDEVADGVYVFWGVQESWNSANGGNIVNTGFIVGEDAVLVVDSGPTRYYGEQMLAAIRAVTDRPIRTAVITHHHPDHAFGAAQLKGANALVAMHPEARAGLRRDGRTLIGFMQVAIGEGWMAGTEIAMPNRLIRRATSFDLGGRTVRVVALVGGHTPGDLVVFDEATGTLFAGDLVFNQRAPTVPHADIPTWLDHLRGLRAMPWRRLVPGHGPLVSERAALDPMADYLTFLRSSARQAVADGEMLAELLATPPPERFRGLATIDVELARSLRDLFRKYDAAAFDAAVAVN